MEEKLKAITEEMGIHKDWYDQAGKQTLKTLPAFIYHVLNDYQHDYGTICHAIAASSLAAARIGAKEGGITGFQAGAIMWEFIRRWRYSDNKCGLKIIDFDNMLYPQYAEKFEKTISRSTWNKLQEVAKKNMRDNKNDVRGQANNQVHDHWKSIADGVVPFGYNIKD